MRARSGDDAQLIGSAPKLKDDALATTPELAAARSDHSTFVALAIAVAVSTALVLLLLVGVQPI